MARDKKCLQSRNLKLIKFFLNLREELTDYGNRRFTYKNCVDETAKKFDLTPSTIEKIVSKKSMAKILAEG